MKKYLQISNRAGKPAKISIEQRQLAFQYWVAYELYGRQDISEGSQFKCPLSGCSRIFDSLNLCLAHLADCSWLSNSWYWCPFCKQGEQFADSGPTSSGCPEVEPSPAVVGECATQSKQRGTHSKTTTARLWKHIGNKLGLVSQPQMFRPPSGVALANSCGQVLSENGSNLVRNPRSLDLDQIFATPLDQRTKADQHYNMGALITASESKQVCTPSMAELEPEYGQRWELQGTPMMSELSDGFDQRQPQELIGSSTVNAYYQHPRSAHRPYPDSINLCHPGQSSRQSEQLPPYICSTKRAGQLGPPLQSSSTVLNLPSYDGFGDTTSTNNSITYQANHLEQSSCLKAGGWLSYPMPPHADVCHNASLLTKTYSLGLQPNEEISGWPLSRYPWCPDALLSTDCDGTLDRSASHCNYQESRYTAPMSHSNMTLFNSPKGMCLSTPNGSLSRRITITEPYDASEQSSQLTPVVSQEAYQSNEGHQQTWSTSPVTSSGNPRSETVSPLSPDGAREVRATHGKHKPFSPVTPLASPSSPNSLMSSYRNSAQSNQTKTSTPPTSTEVSPVSAGTQPSFPTNAASQVSKTRGVSRCPECTSESPTEFHGSYQDRRSNLKRHIQYCHNQQRFKCPTDGCNKDYSRPDNLTKHRRATHQDGLPLQRSNAHKVRRDF